MRALALYTAHVLAVLAIACGFVVGASLLPVSDPATEFGLCLVSGSVGILLALDWLPCPCCRKERRG